MKQQLDKCKGLKASIELVGGRTVDCKIDEQYPDNSIKVLLQNAINREYDVPMYINIYHITTISSIR